MKDLPADRNGGIEQIVLQGSAFERGLSHGKHFADDIRPRVERLWKSTEPERDRIASTMEKTIDMLQNKYPDINDKIRGISKGAGLSFEQVFLYNNRDITGFVYADSCTSICVSDGADIAMGMNKDAPTANLDKYMLKKVYPDKGYAYIGYGHVGRTWGQGMNEKGLCTAGTAAHPLKIEANWPALGQYHVPFIILSCCENVHEAVEFLMGIKSISGAANLLFADSAGQSVIVEVSPGKKVVRKAENGAVFSTNFYASRKIKHSSGPDGLQESQNRFRAIEDILAKHPGPMFDKVKDILQSKLICRHNVLDFNTSLSFIALPVERKFFICHGFPCENEYTPQKLS
jgi:predicted choloylglycine hydrolase